MGRKPRLHIEGGLYHVVARGNNRKEIFKTESDYSTFLNTLLKIKQKTFFKLYAYCLMPNHFHLLLEVNETSTSLIMQRLLTAYTKYYNRKYKTIGHLFQGRFKSIICQKDSYLLELVRYIHLNPFRAKLVKKPSDWLWSGHKEYLGTVDRKIQDKAIVLGMLSDNCKQATVSYAEFVRDGSQIGKRKEYYPQEKLPYLGDAGFQQKLTLQHSDLINKKTLEVKLKSNKTLKELAEIVANKFHVSAVSLCGKVKLKELAQARKELIKEAISNGYKGKEVADFINCSQGYITKIFSDIE